MTAQGIVLLMVVDRLSKYLNFIPMAHPFTIVHVAQIFFTNIIKLHGVLESIVSDWDRIFTSSFWKELFRLNSTSLALITLKQTAIPKW